MPTEPIFMSDGEVDPISYQSLPERGMPESTYIPRRTTAGVALAVIAWSCLAWVPVMLVWWLV